MATLYAGTESAVRMDTPDISTLLDGTVYDSSPLQRRLRDMHAAAQHGVVHQRHYAAVGKQLLATAAAPSAEQIFSIAS